MLFIRKPSDATYVPLHVMPPTLEGLAQSLYLRFNIEPTKVRERERERGEKRERDRHLSQDVRNYH